MRWRVAILCACVFATIAAAPKGQAPISGIPIGVNYSHWHIGPNCDIDNGGILITYHEPGVRATVQAQLAAMRVGGLSALRTIVWHQTLVEPWQRWGVIPSQNGLEEPYRTNLANFATDIRAAGFAHWDVSMGPNWTNAPASDPPFDPSLFDENWRMIQEIRAVVLAAGPADTRIDLLNEGAHSIHQPNFETLRAYDQAIWTRWVEAYGQGGATFSAILDDGFQDVGDRLRNLIEALQETAQPLPDYFEVHVIGDLHTDLDVVDEMLSGMGLWQPLRIGETFYHDVAGKRAATKQYHGVHPLLEYIQWPLTAVHACEPINVNPPYTAQ